MARGVNKVILVGNLGQDPETRTTPGGTTVTNLRIATDRGLEGQAVRREEGADGVAHRGDAGTAWARSPRNICSKGSQVYIEGRLRTRKWQDKSGNDRYSTEVQANEMQMLGGRGGGAPAETRDSRDPGAESFSEGRAYASESRGGGGGGAPAPRERRRGGGADFDDDIPF